MHGWVQAGFNHGISSLQEFHDSSGETLLSKISPPLPQNTHSYCTATYAPKHPEPGVCHPYPLLCYCCYQQFNTTEIICFCMRSYSNLEENYSDGTFIRKCWNRTSLHVQTAEIFNPNHSFPWAHAVSMIYQKAPNERGKHWKFTEKVPVLDLSIDFNNRISELGPTLQFLGGLTGTSRAESGKVQEEVIFFL